MKAPVRYFRYPLEGRGKATHEAGKGRSGMKQVRLLEDRGATSRFVDAEIREDGELVVSGQDVGEAPLEWWGDTDYEWWVTVASKDKPRVLHALLERAQWAGVSLPTIAEDEDSALLTVLKHLYGGRFHAVDEFRDFLESQSIPCGGGTWA